MGMAASQARYLALTARKTNTEYEGQQINQARTALANQSANLFNQLLNLEVPVAPKTTDFTELQYSFSDGDNNSVIESWQQLSNSNPDYNYIVNHYYYANVYTAQQKLLSNPEVTLKGNVDPAPWANESKNTPPVVKIEQNEDGSCSVKIDDEELGITYYPVTLLNKNKETENALKDLAEANIIPKINDMPDVSQVLMSEDPVTGTLHFIIKQEIEAAETDPTALNDYIVNYAPSKVGNSDLIPVGGELTDKGRVLTKDQAAELAQIIKDFPDSNIAKFEVKYERIDGKEVAYLVPPKTEDYPVDIDVRPPEIPAIYSFQMNGKTYFACDKDLYNSLQTYDEYGKPIEAQEKLPYYSASYVRTKIESTNHALLETDGSGRFTSVKFDDDSIVYTLNTETVTDDKAYEDAMNEYNYKIRQYEKTIADINAKTSIIQKEDRTLELRLKQLDTEQNALATEMDAVKKVIKDNVEKTFKTFSD